MRHSSLTHPEQSIISPREQLTISPREQLTRSPEVVAKTEHYRARKSWSGPKIKIWWYNHPVCKTVYSEENVMEQIKEQIKQQDPTKRDRIMVLDHKTIIWLNKGGILAAFEVQNNVYLSVSILKNMGKDFPYVDESTQYVLSNYETLNLVKTYVEQHQDNWIQHNKVEPKKSTRLQRLKRFIALG